MKLFLRLFLSVWFFWLLLPVAGAFSVPQLNNAYTRFNADTEHIIAETATGNLTSLQQSFIALAPQTVSGLFTALDIAVQNHNKNAGIHAVEQLLTLHAQLLALQNTSQHTSIYTPLSPASVAVSTSQSNTPASSPVNTIADILATVRFYSDSFEWQTTANGDTFSQWNYSSARCSVPLWDALQVMYNNTSVIVKNNDRTNCSKQADTLDLSTSAFNVFAPLSKWVLRGATYRDLGAFGNITKHPIAADTFKDLWILLDTDISNIYAPHGTLRIRGKVTDGKTDTFLKLSHNDEVKNLTDSVNANGTFEYDIPLEETGTYQVVIASGEHFYSNTSATLYVANTRPFANAETFTGENFPQISTLSLQRKELANSQGKRVRILPINIFSFADDNLYTVAVTQNTLLVKGSWMGAVAFFPDDFSAFDTKLPVHIQITEQKSSTVFEEDAYTAPQVVYAKDTILSPSYVLEQNEPLAVQVNGNTLDIRGTLTKNKAVQHTTYVTYPDGHVEEGTFDSTESDSGGYLYANIPLDARLNLTQTGEYLVEVNYGSGFAAINMPVSVGDNLPLFPNVTDVYDSLTDTGDILGNTQRFIRYLWNTNKLQANDDLMKLAQLKANDMATFNYVGHIDSGKTYIDGMAKRNGIDFYGTVGENVAGGNLSFGHLLSGLALSSSHRENMLDQTWTDFGVGFAEANGNLYYVQLFGKHN